MNTVLGCCPARDVVGRLLLFVVFTGTVTSFGSREVGFHFLAAPGEGTGDCGSWVTEGGRRRCSALLGLILAQKLGLGEVQSLGEGCTADIFHLFATSIF